MTSVRVSPPPPPNLGTATAAGLFPTWPPARDPRRLYAEALELRERVRPLDRRAWMVAHREGGRTHHCFVTSEPSDHLVVGRHERCDVRLEYAGEVSLRHLLVRPALGETRGVELIGLRGLEELRVLGVGPVRRAIARGPIVALLGAAPIVIIPAHGALPEELPPPDVERLAWRSSSSELGTLESISLTEVRATGPSLTITDTRGRQLTLSPERTELEDGLVLGRYDRCDLRGTELEMPRQLSRVHALLIRDGDTLRIYDLASINGVTVERGEARRPVRSFAFDRREPASFSLARQLFVEWRP